MTPRSYDLTALAYVQSMRLWAPDTQALNYPSSLTLIAHLSRLPEPDRNALAASLIRAGLAVSQVRGLLGASN